MVRLLTSPLNLEGQHISDHKDLRQPLPPNQSQYLPQVSSQFRQSQQSQHSQQALNHARSRSDTITPQNAMEYALSPTRGNSLDDTGSGFSFTNGGYDQEVGARFRRQWGSLSPSTRHMVGNPDPLEPFFKSVQERNLVRSASLAVVSPL